MIKKKKVKKIDLPKGSEFEIDDEFIKNKFNLKTNSYKNLEFYFTDNYMLISFEEVDKPISGGAFTSR